MFEMIYFPSRSGITEAKTIETLTPLNFFPGMIICLCLFLLIFFKGQGRIVNVSGIISCPPHLRFVGCRFTIMLQNDSCFHFIRDTGFVNFIF